MKRMIRIPVLAVMLFTGMMTVSAQNVQIDLIQKVPVLPATVTSYMDDPFHYFNVVFTLNHAGSDGLDIFLDMDFTVNTSPFYVRTKTGTVPGQPIHLSRGANIMDSKKLSPQVQGRLDYYVDLNKPLSVMQLPEGHYTLCVDVYRWSDKDNPAREPISNQCISFDICYSGSAPELVSPMAGAQLALNGAMVVSPARKVNFHWTPVISNCARTGASFNYKLKVVKVLEGQNYQDAIKYNPTAFSATVRSTTYAVFDTLRDIKVPMEKGALYVAQVQAEQVKTRDAEADFVVANDGNSQPIPFFWDHLPDRALVGADGNTADGYSKYFNYYMEDEAEEGEESEGVAGLTQWEGGVEAVSELETIAAEMKGQYLASFIQDDASVAGLTEVYPEERKYVPVPKRRYVASEGYYTVPMTEDLEVSFMPTRHGSLKKASYAIELYNYIEGGFDSIITKEPLLKEVVETLPDRYNKMDSHELVSRNLAGWGAKLEQGGLYYLQLSGFFTVGYWNYSIADTSFYVNELLAEHVRDTVSREYMEEEMAYANGVYFQWGEDPTSPDFKTPQWKTPVNRTGDDIYDPLNHTLPVSVPEVKKAKTFPVSWTPVQNVAQGDKVEYEVNVYELKSGQTLEEALSSNMAVVTRTVTEGNGISEKDEAFFKVFAPKKTYVMTLRTNVQSELNTYHFENGNAALPIVFKMVR